ncbi:hypothetical protein [Sinomicrobium sp. M5D2P9]
MEPTTNRLDLQQRLGIPGTVMLAFVIYFILGRATFVIRMLTVYASRLEDIPKLGITVTVESGIGQVLVDQFFALIGFLILQKCILRGRIYFHSWKYLFGFCLAWSILTYFLTSMFQAVAGASLANYIYDSVSIPISKKVIWIFFAGSSVPFILGLVSLRLSILIFPRVRKGWCGKVVYRRNVWVSTSLMTLSFSVIILFVLRFFMETPYSQADMPVNWIIGSQIMELGFWILFFLLPGFITILVFRKTVALPGDSLSISAGILAGAGLPFLTFVIVRSLVRLMDIDSYLGIGSILLLVFSSLFLGFCLLFARFARSLQADHMQDE